ncbi:MAG: twin-arginine translocase TatA/TatE family subunit [Thermoanaerobacterales bacterium]|jgi:sec-independent protein translocase protein TatA|nr:twin-arginine translocase TatA/TatE family subunit [Thermoanaerobacterales bacterium]
MMLNIGAGELILILVVVLIVFGPGKLPEVAKSMGKAMREFRKASSSLQRVWDDVTREETPATNKTAYSSRTETSSGSSEEKDRDDSVSEESTAKQAEQAEQNGEETQDQPV